MHPVRDLVSYCFACEGENCVEMQRDPEGGAVYVCRACGETGTFSWGERPWKGIEAIHRVE